MTKFTDDNNPFTIANPDIEERKKESAQIRSSYPDRYPVIVYTDESKFNLEKNKYLAPDDITLAQFMTVIRKRAKLSSTEAIWLFIKGIMPATSSTIASLYEKNVAEDGFLYIKLMGENAFGGF
jgi:GABA(A) receptor-associated protein